MEENHRAEPPRPAEGGEVLTFRAACERLGISEKTLRARIKKGEVESFRVEGPFGWQWRIRLPAEAQGGGSATHNAQRTTREGEGFRHEPRATSHEPRATSHEPPATGELVPVETAGAVPLALYQELLAEHRQALVQLGRYQERGERVPALEAGVAAREAEARERDALFLKQQQQRDRWLLLAWSLILALLAALVVLLLRPGAG